jgi:hypothetical protein
MIYMKYFGRYYFFKQIRGQLHGDEQTHQERLCQQPKFRIAARAFPFRLALDRFGDGDQETFLMGHDGPVARFGREPLERANGGVARVHGLGGHHKRPEYRPVAQQLAILVLVDQV